jgi:hypothetical protein
LKKLGRFILEKITPLMGIVTADSFVEIFATILKSGIRRVVGDRGVFKADPAKVRRYIFSGQACANVMCLQAVGHFKIRTKGRNGGSLLKQLGDVFR